MIINCPHCDQMILVEKIKCGIFRCGIYKKTGRQVGSHSKEKYIKKLLKNNKIYGCGNPFKYNKKTKIIEKCDWI